VLTPTMRNELLFVSHLYWRWLLAALRTHIEPCLAKSITPSPIFAHGINQITGRPASCIIELAIIYTLWITGWLSTRGVFFPYVSCKRQHQSQTQAKNAKLSGTIHVTS